MDAKERNATNQINAINKLLFVSKNDETLQQQKKTQMHVTNIKKTTTHSNYNGKQNKHGSSDNETKKVLAK